MPVLLEAKNISKSYLVNSGLFGGSSVSVLHDVSLQLQAGEILAIVGESGSGKSTLARQLVMLEQPDSGEIFLGGKSFQSIPDIHHQVRMIFQNPAASLDPRKRVYQLLEEPLINLTKLPGSKREELIYHTLDQVGLNRGQVSRYPHMFSGGQRQRIAIARAILIDPAILMLDEAASALDAESERLVQAAIERLKGTRTILIVAHRLSTIMRADRIFVLERGRIVETGTLEELLSLNGRFKQLHDMQFGAERIAHSAESREGVEPP